MKTSIRSLALAAFGACAVPAPAFAHAHLTSASPAIGSTVSVSPAELDLRFSEGLNLKFTGVKVTGPAAVSTGDPKLGGTDSATLIVPVTAPLAPGAYKVDWHALSNDGHKTAGSYSFTVKP